MTESNVVKLNVHQKEAPSFITPHDISKMSDEELDELIEAIKVRRLQSYVVYKQTKDEKDRVEAGKTRERIEKKCTQIIRKLNTIDKHMDDFEKYISELRGLRLQAGLELI